MDIDDLVRRSNELDSTARKIQNEEQVGLSIQEIQEFVNAYHAWLADSLAVLPEELKGRLRVEYNGSLFSPRIKSFLTAPTKISQLAFTSAGSRSVFPYWQYPYETTFRLPLIAQQQILIEAGALNSKQAVESTTGLFPVNIIRNQENPELQEKMSEISPKGTGESEQQTQTLEIQIPDEIRRSLVKFRRDHPDPAKVAFIMMKFGNTDAYKRIADVIKTTMKAYGIVALLANDKTYNNALFPNILTYMWGCGLGISVFERIESNEYNPNVALETGYMFALGKQVCLLKDRTLPKLHTDLGGMIFYTFDTRDLETTIPAKLESWLRDMGIIDE